MNGKHKLYDHEVTPPPAAWDRIAAALDEDASLQPLGMRLYDVETVPPVTAWDRLRNELDQEAGMGPEHATPVIVSAAPTVLPADDTISSSRTFRMPVFLRYAAAAAVIAFIAFAIFRNNGGTRESVALAVNNQPVAPVVETPKPVKPTNNLPSPGIPDVDSGSNAALPAVAANTAGGNHLYNTSRNISTYRRGNNPSGEEPQNALYAYDDHLPESADRYILLMTPEGTFIRMAKKLSSLVCCVSGQEQDAECKDQIRKWQQQIATSPVSPAPGNVMDILDLVNSLNNGTQL